MNVLLLGGSGNLSRDVAILLRYRKHSVSCMTRGRRPIPPGCLAVTGDRACTDDIRRAAEAARADVVIDFIGYQPDDCRVVVDALAGRVAQFIFISTTAVHSRPFERLPVTEESPVGNLHSPYGRAKQACETYLRRTHDEARLPVTIVRPSHTYSCQWIPHPVTSSSYTLAARLEAGKPVFIHGDGQGLWTLTHTRDFAVGLAGLAGLPAALGETYQITSDFVMTWNQIMAETIAALGLEAAAVIHLPTDVICDAAPIMAAKLLGDKAHDSIFDNRKIKEAVPDFDCHISFRQGIREAVSWFREDPARQTVNAEMDAVFDAVAAAWQNR